MINSQLPPVLAHSTTNDSAEWLLSIPTDYAGFAGHFPEHPILPGVLQLDWAIKFGCQAFGYDTSVAQIEILKFQQLIKPGMQISLQIDHQPHKQKLQFIFSNDSHKFASGRIALHTQGTQ